MDVFAGAERLMGMTDRSWRRHANPWSVWTRIPIGPLLVLALYARAWIDWWCLVPTALVLVWNWVNPRAFPEPDRWDSWSARGVLGERLFLNRRQVPIPASYQRAAMRTTIVSLLGVPPTLYGLVMLEPWSTTAGAAVMLAGKLWFIDRMVRLQDAVGSTPDRV